MFTSFVTLFLHVASADRVTVHDDEVSMMQGLAKTVSLHASTPALCCHAMTPECVACTLGTEDIEAFCCSASQNHDQCMDGGVEYDIQPITVDISSTTTYSMDGLTCTHHVPVCCEANTPACVACKLGTATDDIEALCCSASADHSACMQGGVEYAISVDFTADPNLIGTTYSWDGSTTCAVSTLEDIEAFCCSASNNHDQCTEGGVEYEIQQITADISSTTTYSLDGLTCTHHVPVCCEANTPACVACKLGIATDDIEALCCSASADHSACTQGGVEYAISVDLTADPNLIGTTYSWDGSTTCAVSTLEQGEYELVGGGGPGYKCDEFMFSSQMYDSRADCALACFQYSPEGGAAGINDKTRTTEPLCTHYNWNKNSGRCRFCVGDGTQSAGNNNAVYHNDVRLAPSN